MDAESPTPFTIPSEDEKLLAECRVDVFRAGGKGGQHQNKTDSGVRLTHLATGVKATSRNERSQYRNKRLALQRLRRKLEKRLQRDAPRIPTKVPRREMERRKEQKRQRGHTKRLRKPPSTDRDA